MADFSGIYQSFNHVLATQNVRTEVALAYQATSRMASFSLPSDSSLNQEN